MNPDLKQTHDMVLEQVDYALESSSPSEIRKAVNCAELARSQYLEAMEDITGACTREGRSELRASEQRDWDEVRTALDSVDAKLTKLKAAESRAQGVLTDPKNRAAYSSRASGGFGRRPGPWDQVRSWHDAGEVRSRAHDALDSIGVDTASAERALWVAEKDDDFAKGLVALSDPNYQSAFLRMLANPDTAQMAWSPAEREAVQRAMVVSTNTQGGYGVPTMLDPTIILTNDGAEDMIRQVARVVTVREGNTFVGISSAGVSASWDDELEEVSDDSPSLNEVRIPVHKAQAFVPYSIEASQDITNLEGSLRMALSDAKVRLEAAAFATGSGTGEPTGLFTALDADTNVELLTTTAATVGLVDLHAVYRALPIRWRRRASWLMNPLWLGGIRQLGSAVGASFTGDLREALPERILGKLVIESDDAPELQTTTTKDNILVFGDMKEYVIADRAGLTVELIQHIFGNTNNRPVGARALYAYWRVGAEPTTTSAFRLLQDRTSA